MLHKVFTELWTVRASVSGLPRYVFVTGAFAVAGKYLNDFRNQYLAERDAVFRHYVSLHPEDFPPYGKICNTSPYNNAILSRKWTTCEFSIKSSGSTTSYNFSFSK